MGAAVVASAQRLEAANPTWSPDGTQIAFAYLGAPRGRVEVMSAADGSGKHARYSADSCCEPVLWAAGNRIAFVSNFELFSVGQGGGKPTKLFRGTPWFILSPNRETVALDDGCGCGHAPDSIALVSVRGGKPFIIARPKNTSDSIDGFSPGRDAARLHAWRRGTTTGTRRGDRRSWSRTSISAEHRCRLRGAR